jgi:hypothetical protein
MAHDLLIALRKELRYCGSFDGSSLVFGLGSN